MEKPKVESYDEVGYPSFPVYYSHPNRLATIATILGMKPAPVEQCRVLEMGCYDGANLAAMAMGLPNCEFVGIDAAGTAIARGQTLAEEIGLKNLTLRHLNLMEIAPDYGKFDYIVAHGLYSWVPEPVRKQIMAICKGSLAPQGVAYISYNAFPGCHTRVMLREMIQFHNRDFQDPYQQMHEGLNLLRVLAHSLEDESESYSKLMREELDRFSERDLESLYHDELAEVFTPFYFHEFMDQARRHDLQFLAEANFYDMVPRGLNPKAVEILDKIGDDIVLREQYLDFMRGRHFRRTLLCHGDVTLNRTVNPQCIRQYYVSTLSRPQSPTPNFEPGVKEAFEDGNGAKVSSADPIARSLFWHLQDKGPERLPFPQLAADVEMRARQQLGFVPTPDQDVASDIADFIWATYRVGLLDLHVHIPPFVVYISDKPLASPLARWQALRGDMVSTLQHRILRLDNPIQRGLLSLLDGSRNRTELRTDVLQFLKSGKLDLRDAEGKPVTDLSVEGKAVDDELEVFFQRAAKTGVLMA